MGKEDYQEQTVTTGGNFAQYILDEWLETAKLGKEVRFNILTKHHDAEILHNYIINLCNLWLQLKPKVRGRKFKSDENLEERFFSFKTFRLDPQKILELNKEKEIEDAVERKEALFEIEEVIRDE